MNPDERDAYIKSSEPLRWGWIGLLGIRTLCKCLGVGFGIYAVLQVGHVCSLLVERLGK